MTLDLALDDREGPLDHVLDSERVDIDRGRADLAKLRRADGDLVREERLEVIRVVGR